MLRQGGFVGLQPVSESLLPFVTILGDVFPGGWVDVEGFEVLFADILVAEQWAANLPFA